MDPDVSLFLPADSVALTAADRAALADLTAGRLIDSGDVAARLGGWRIARDDIAGGADAGVSPSRSPTMAGERNAIAVSWTHAAAADCERLCRLVTALDGDRGARLAAAVVTAMVRLIVEGRDRPNGIADVPLLPSVALRVVVADERLVVLGLRERLCIR